MTRAVGLAAAVAYGVLIVWLYATRPQTFEQFTGGLAASVGAYHIDRQAFDDGRAFFAREQFAEARAAFARADPARRDPLVQFYIGYACYRQGWGRVYSDDALFREGLAAVDRAIAVAPDHRLIVTDPALTLHSADELRAELERGLTRSADDYNPLRLFRSRK